MSCAARRKCATRSWGSSSPTAKRIVAGRVPALASAFSSRSECVFKVGQLMIVFDYPRLIMCAKAGDKMSKKRLTRDVVDVDRAQRCGESIAGQSGTQRRIFVRWQGMAVHVDLRVRVKYKRKDLSVDVLGEHADGEGLHALDDFIGNIGVHKRTFDEYTFQNIVSCHSMPFAERPLGRNMSSFRPITTPAIVVPVPDRSLV